MIKYLIVLLSAVSAIIFTPKPAVTQVSSLEILSKNSSAEIGNASSSYPAISDVGDIVVFESQADNLVADDLNQQSDIFASVSGEAPQRISLTSTGAESSAAASHPLVISGDGNLAVFLSEPGAFSAPDESVKAACEQQALFLHDRRTHSNNELVLTNDSLPLNGFSYPVDMNVDGRYLLLVSSATNVAADMEEGTHLLLHDTQAGTTEIIQQLYTNSLWSEYPFQASLSADGRFIAFTSCVAPSDTPQTMCHCEAGVYLYDRESKTSKLISANASGEAADATSTSPAISADGKYVAFSSAATNLVSETPPEASSSQCHSAQIYIYDRVNSSLALASVSASGEEANSNCTTPSLSATGRYLFFASSASNLLASEEVSAKCEDSFVYRKDMQTGAIMRIEQNADASVAVAKSSMPAAAANGLTVAFSAKAPAAAASEEEEPVTQVYMAKLDGEPDSVIIEQPSVKSLMKSLNAAIRSAKPSVNVASHKATIHVQGFAKLSVKSSSSAKALQAGSMAKTRTQKFLSRYEIMVTSRNSASKMTKRLSSRPSQILKLAKGSYRVIYRVKAINRSSGKSYWTKKSASSLFLVK